MSRKLDKGQLGWYVEFSVEWKKGVCQENLTRGSWVDRWSLELSGKREYVKKT